jgi:hypothetical protein
MSEDLISNNFVDNINRTVIKKTLWFSKAVLSLTIIYAIADLLNWYNPFVLSMKMDNLSNTEYFNYRILPVVDIILLSSSIISWSYCVKANKFINLSFEKNDADLFNKAYQYFYRSSKLIFTVTFLAIAGLTTRLFLK